MDKPIQGVTTNMIGSVGKGTFVSMTTQKVSDREYENLAKEIRRLLIELKKQIGDEYRCSNDPDDNTPGMIVTVGATAQDDGTLSWSYQTGDNSYSGGAYFHRTWGVGYLYRRSNCVEVAQGIVDEIAEAIESN